MKDFRDLTSACQQLIERLPLAAYATLIDREGSVININRAVEQMLGFACSEHHANPSLWSDQIHPHDRERVLGEVADCHAAGSVLETSYRMSTRDGRVIKVNDVAAIISHGKDSERCKIGVLTEITEHEYPERRPHGRDTTHRDLIEYTSELVVKVDPDGKFLFVSPSYCALFGISEEELLGKKFMPLVHEDDRESTHRAMQALHRPPYHAYMEQRAMTKSGWRWLAWTDNAILNAGGNIAAIVGVGRDITEKKRMEEALRASQHRLRQTMEYANLGHWELIKDGLTANWSDEIYEIFDIEKSLAAGPGTLKELVHPDDRSCVLRSLEHALDQGSEHHVDYRIRRSDGTERWVECRAQAVRGTDGKIEKLSGFLQDITARKEAEAALRRSEERFRVVATATNDVIYEWGTDGDELLWYGDIDKALGYRPSGFPRTLSAWIAAIHSEDRPSILKEVERVRDQGGTIDLTYRIATADGTWRTWRDTGQTLKNEDGHTVTLIGGCTDVTEQRLAEEKVHHLAFHDSLTGLPNRLLFKEELRQTLENFRRNQKQFALHYLDLDHFKDINDSLGHQVGDELLCEVVTRVKAITRGVDLFSRLGGDEFGLIQTNIDDASQASVFAAKIIQTLGREFQLQDKTVRINTSIGVVVPDDSQIDADDLLKRADTALYKAKEAGRGTFAFFRDSMTIKLQREMELVHYLASAIRADQFFLEYQPQYDLANRRLVGLEALIRWNHPERGLLMPGDFLPVAEKRGLIGEISDWALLAACRQAKQWDDHGRMFGRVAVNLCAMQVNSDYFFERTMEVLQTNSLDPMMLELEFTETVLMRASDSTKQAIQRLSDLGVRFAIDDFGTGFSSLSYLKNFHTDKIKIDREFIRDVHLDPSDAEIVKATIALGVALGLETLAEGVESSAQLEFLVSQGCKQAQGFHLGRPMSVDEITEILERTR